MQTSSPQADGFLDKVVTYLSAPFSTWDAVIENLAKAPNTFIGLDSKTGLLYLFSGLLVALLIYRTSRTQLPEPYQRSFWGYVFPRAIYTHPSAIVDYKFVGFDLLVKFFLYIPIALGASQFAYIVFTKLSVDLSFGLVSQTHYLVRLSVITILSALIVDFSVFFSHYLAHKIPFLWPFHEIHHSAEVLTPVTVHRVHPVEEIVNGVVVGSVSGILAATYTAISTDVVEPYTLFGINIISFIYYLSLYQLRHSHVWLSYGPKMSHIIVSPAQHQIHHSIDKKHWNKNYGHTFAIWDWMFGSLYVPEEREEIRFGVPDVEMTDFASVPKLYFLPFVKSFRRAKKMISARSLRFDFEDVADAKVSVKSGLDHVSGHSRFS